jgi:hypothetical protein
MRVAVITPYYREDLETLRKCHESVRQQTHPCTHFMVADGHPLDEIASWPVENIILSTAHNDSGNTPRGIGSFSAMNQGYDAIAYLDADNWFYPNHIQSMVDLHRNTGADVYTASRTIHRWNGSLMFADQHDNDGKRHVDTSCLFLTRAAFHVLPLWVMMPKELGPVCDRIMWQAIRARRISHAHHPEPTVAFRTQYQIHYQAIGETPPPGTKSTADSIGKSDSWWRSLPPDVRNGWARYFSNM